MNKTLLFFSAVFIITPTLFGQKIIEGKEANNRINGSKLIRFVPQRQAPDYISLNASANITGSTVQPWLSSVLGLRENEALVQEKVEHDELGITHIKYQHTYSGIPVEFSGYRIHMKNNVVQSANGEFYANIAINSTPTYTSQDAINAALGAIGAKNYRFQNPNEEAHLKAKTGNPNATYAPQPELVIVALNGDYLNPEFRLCYKMDVYASLPLSRHWVYIDAHSGEVVWKLERIHETDTPGSASTFYSGTQTIVADSFNGSFRLRETGRGLGVETYDMNTSTDYSTAVDFTDTDNNWGVPTPAIDQFALDAHWGAEMTYDYFNLVHNRNSIDNNGFPLISYVHYDANYANAFWDGQEMTYGDGDGGTFNHPLTTIDITGHEITHGLTENTANLVYQDEPGGLNESFSDIFGVTIDNYAKGTTGNSLWRIGEECTSSGNGIRLMSNPNTFGDPDTYQGTNWVAAGGPDNGGVHSNSGVQNFWYYLLCQGGTGTNDNSEAYSVSGISITKSRAIAFRNLTVYLGSNAQFADSRFYSIVAAQDLFGGCSPEVISTTNAWHAVGVGPVFDATVNADFTGNTTTVCNSQTSIDFTNLSSNGESYIWYFGDGTTSTNINPSHIYTANGTYSVSLAVDGGNCGTDSINVVSYINVNVPDIPSAADQAICQGTGSVTLTSNGGGTAYWFDTPTSTTPVFIGNTFVTPILTTSTTYYVSDNVVNGSGNVGPTNNSFGGGGQHNNSSTQYIEFEIFQPLTIHTVDVFAGAAGNRTIQIWDAAGNQIDAITVSIPNGASTVSLEKYLTPGNYRIGGSSMNLYRNNAGASFPYDLPNLVSITGSSAGSGFYYYFYNWDVSSNCTSDRVPVNVTLGGLIANFSTSQNGSTVTFSNTSVGGTSYQWDFGNGMTSTLTNPVIDFGSVNTATVTLVVSNGSCSDTIIQVLQLNDAGIGENGNLNSWSISPNPFNNSMNIHVDGIALGANLSIDIYNALGQNIAEVFKGNTVETSMDLNWSPANGIESGVYFVRLTDGITESIQRVIKL